YHGRPKGRRGEVRSAAGTDLQGRRGAAQDQRCHSRAAQAEHRPDAGDQPVREDAEGELRQGVDRPKTAQGIATLSFAKCILAPIAAIGPAARESGMFDRSMRSASVIIATAMIAALGLFLLVASLAEHRNDGRLLIEAALFLPLLLLCSVHAVHARRS